MIFKSNSKMLKSLAILLAFVLIVSSFSFSGKSIATEEDQTIATESVDEYIDAEPAAPVSEIETEEPIEEPQVVEEDFIETLEEEAPAEEVKEEVPVEEVKEDALAEEVEEFVETEENTEEESTYNPSTDIDNLGDIGYVAPVKARSISAKFFREPANIASLRAEANQVTPAPKTSPVIGIDHPTEEGEVMLYKVAEPVEGMVNTWDVTLRMEAKDIKTKTSIVLVIDRSGSMKDRTGGSGTPTKMEDAKSAANSFINSMLTEENSNFVKIGLVSYSSHHDRYSYTTVTNNSNLTNNKDNLISAVNSINANGGTNTQAGIEAAKTMLDADNGADNKYIVLLSDGIPTAYINDQGKDAGSGTETSSDISSEYAINSATKIKEAGIDIFTVAVAAGYKGNSILSQIASPGSAVSTNDSSQLVEIFQNIADQISSAMKNASVGDPMGSGFEIPAANVSDITITTDPQTEVSYNNGIISWHPGTLTKEVEGQDGVKYAQITYRIEINDDILNENSNDGTFATNGDASVTYTNALGEETTALFPVPYVNPVLYSVNKVLLDKDDNEKTEDRDFTISVTGQDYNIDYVVNPSVNNGGKLMTDLRNAAEYIVAETAIAGRELTDYETTIKINGVETNTFNIVDGNTDDMKVEVINQEIPIDIPVIKVWNDNDNQDGIRPTSVTFQILNGEEVVSEAEVTESTDWKHTFEGLDRFDAEGNRIEYTVKELGINEEDYSYEITGSKEEGFTVTNTHPPKKTEVKGTKTWNDNDDQDGIRPDSITVNLLADGEVIDTLTVSGTEWSYEFLDLPQFKDGKEIVYSIEEEAVEGYETTTDGYNLTNTHTPAVVALDVTKAWADANNQDGVRPESVTVTLVANGQATEKTVTLTETNNWTATFTELDKYEAGQEIVYTVEELTLENGYQPVITGDASTGYVVTNTRTPEVIEITGTKTWDDANNQDGKRPESITIRLLANGTEVASQTVTGEEWSWNFTDLPKYENGEEIVYTITEDAIEGYSSTVSGYNVTNSYTPEKTSVQVTKAWADANNQDGVRPESVTVTLVANGQATEKTVTLTETNNWTATFTELDKYEAGQEIVYTVEELTLENGYQPVITGDASTGYVVTNTRTPEVTEITGTKTWDDANNQDGKRPESITIRLLANGTEVASQTVTGEEWSWNFTDLPKYENGEEIVYTITEDAIEGYSSTVNGYDVTNSYTPEQTSVQVTKAWADANNQDGVRPESVTVTLLADGEETDQTLTLTETNNWTGTFTELDKYKDGTEIVYTVEELELENGYEPVITGDATAGYVITNTRTPEVIEVVGSKTWDDADNQDGKRPESITIRLLANGTEVANQIVTGEEWSWNFTDLPKYENGEEIVYTITEDAIEGYSSTVNGYDVTNSYTPEQTSVQVTKAWADANNQDGVRPESVTVTLLADGEETDQTLTLTETNNWTATFTELDKYEAGQEIVYTVEELTLENGYQPVITGDASTGYVVTNTRTPEVIEITGTKTWDDANNQDGKRPESITIRLLANGVEKDTLTVTEEQGWAWSFTDLAKYEAGQEIVYTITEDAIEGYSSTVNGYDVTNSYTPEQTSVQVTKAWADANNQDGVRPEAVTVTLVANGQATEKTVTLTETNNWTATFTELDKYEAGQEIVYTVEELTLENGYQPVITGDASTGYVVTNTRTPEVIEITGTKTWDDANNQDGKRPESITIRLLANGTEVASQTVTGEEWSWNFTDLPKYENGEEIVYTITEDAIEGYSSTVNGYDVTNSYTPEQTSVQVTKAWADANNQDGVRPEAVTVTLVANGQATEKTVTLTETNNWTATFTELDKYEAGQEIVYTVEELTFENGYQPVITGDASTGYVVTNTRTPEVTEITGTKTWDDANNQDGKRPESITIRLLANGTEVASQTVTGEEWSWNFTDLPKYENGEEIVYTITEDAIEGYSSTVNGYDVTNSYTPEQTSVQVTKAWADANNQDGVRPESVTVTLLADGEETDQTLTLTETNNWTGTFTELDKYKDGTEIVYTVEELELENGYEPVITGDATAGYVITNTRTPEVIEVVGSKTWDDADNQDGKRPESITIRLLANGTEVANQIVTGEEWSWNFTDLPKYENGEEIVYTITEDAIEGYSSTVNGYDVTNSYTPEQTSVQVTKAWADANNQDGVRPESVTVTLLADGEETDQTLTLTETNNWTGTFTELDKYKDGTEIVYTVEELELENGYEPVITGDATAGYVITNTRTPEVIEVVGSKTWDDADNQDGKRPESITIRLLANGTEVASQTVTGEEWTWNFTDLPKYENGEEIVYTITEDAIEGYSSTVNGYDVTNSYTPEKTSVQVTKKWLDENDKDQIRPDKVTMILIANGERTDKELVLTAENNWTGTFTELDVNMNGEKIVYTIEELDVKGYTSTVTGDMETGFVVTNIHEPKEEPVVPDVPKDPEPKVPQDKHNPKTGDYGASAFVGMMALAGAGLVITKKKENEEA